MQERIRQSPVVKRSIMLPRRASVERRVLSARRFPQPPAIGPVSDTFGETATGRIEQGIRKNRCAT